MVIGDAREPFHTRFIYANYSSNKVSVLQWCLYTQSYNHTRSVFRASRDSWTKYVIFVWNYNIRIITGFRLLVHKPNTDCDMAWNCCIRWYPSETHLMLKSREISFLLDIHLIWEIVLKFCTEHGSNTTVLYAKVQNDFTTEQKIMGKWDFTRLEVWCISDE